MLAFGICLVEAAALAYGAARYFARGAVTGPDGERTALAAILPERARRVFCCVLAAAAAALAAYGLWRGGGLAFWAVRVFLVVFLGVIAAIDLRLYIIPNRVLLVGLLAAAPALAAACLVAGSPLRTLVDSGLGLLLGGGVFGLCALLSRGGMGAGDVKLYGLLGLFLGFQDTFRLLFWSILLLALTGIFLLLFRGKSKKTMLPMGPFALVGLAAVLIFGA